MDVAATSRVLHGERDAALAQIATLTEDFDGMVAASAASNADDEHDPEGATIAFERAQVVAVLELARRHLAELDAALLRLAAGSYGACETCGAAISAISPSSTRPAAATCIACAASVRR